MTTELRELVYQLSANINDVVLGKEDVVRLCLVALLSGEHILLEDVPGVGKTLVGKALRGASRPTFAEFSSRRICSRATLSVAASLTRRPVSSYSTVARCSRTSSWPMKSTARRRGPKVHCSKQ